MFNILSFTFNLIQNKMVTKKQIDTLKYIVAMSWDISDRTKKLLLILLEKSENFTKEVHITLKMSDEEPKGSIMNIGYDIDRLNSSNGNTHMNELLSLIGEFRFSIHYGRFTAKGEFSTDGQFEKSENAIPCYTFWLAKKTYSNVSDEVIISLEEIDAKEIICELYPRLNKEDWYNKKSEQ